MKEDIEIAGFLVSIISWGNRKTILRNGHRMADMLGGSPYDFVMSSTQKELDSLDGFVHRTFQKIDFVYILKGLKHIYHTYGGMENIFRENNNNSLQPTIHVFKKRLFEIPHPPRTTKHIPDPLKGSAAKKINLFLRWMIRKDEKGVDFGIWPSISPKLLSCPLDVHSGNVARKLGLLNRHLNDNKAVEELDISLRQFDQNDPVKYDFALFGLGIYENVFNSKMSITYPKLDFRIQPQQRT